MNVNESAKMRLDPSVAVSVAARALHSKQLDCPCSAVCDDLRHAECSRRATRRCSMRCRRRPHPNQTDRRHRLVVHSRLLYMEPIAADEMYVVVEFSSLATAFAATAAT